MRVLVTGGSGFIGTNLTGLLASRGIDFLNVDIVSPKDQSLVKNWVPCDILQYEQLEKTLNTFSPTIVVHLAAETDTDPSKTIDDYRVNTEGTRNLIKAIQNCLTVTRVIFTSTQFVNQSVKGPQHDEDFAPFTVYGESKVINEKDIRNSGLIAEWVIIRPTNVWGPWHLRYPYEFWKVLAEKKYIHPGGSPVVRSYGYVGNVCNQVIDISQLPSKEVNHKVFYVGDRPIDLLTWVNGFSIAQTGNKVTIVPRWFVFILALMGDFLKIFNIRIPISTSRFRSMTTSNPVDMEGTFKVVGEKSISLAKGIEETVNWMQKFHPRLITK
jgi:GlcNAc-P-P-Und epimerase